MSALRRLAPDVVEVTVERERRLRYLPGQYFNFKFGSFSARSYSPTRPLRGHPRPQSLTLQVRRHERGQVSSQIGREIRAGHPVAIEGPFGSAFFREGKTARLILASGRGRLRAHLEHRLRRVAREPLSANPRHRRRAHG